LLFSIVVSRNAKPENSLDAPTIDNLLAMMAHVDLRVK
jgi:hypothetical protein